MTIRQFDLTQCIGDYLADQGIETITVLQMRAVIQAAEMIAVAFAVGQPSDEDETRVNSRAIRLR